MQNALEYFRVPSRALFKIEDIIKTNRKTKKKHYMQNALEYFRVRSRALFKIEDIIKTNRKTKKKH